jgi:hypothetical protein
MIARISAAKILDAKRLLFSDPMTLPGFAG